VAWNLETSERKTVQLPHRPSKVVTSGDVVGVIGTENASIYIWEFGGRLRQVDLAAPEKHAKKYLKTSSSRSWLDEVNLILHPHDKEAFFLVVLLRRRRSQPPSERPLPPMVVVYEFENLQFKAPLVPELSSVPTNREKDKMSLDCQRLNKYGLYSLVTVAGVNTEVNTSEVPTPEFKDYPAMITWTFNPHTKEFSQYRHAPPVTATHDPSRYTFTTDLHGVMAHKWNDQCTIWTHHALRRMIGTGVCIIEDVPLLTLNDFTVTERQTDVTEVKMYTSTTTKFGQVSRRQALNFGQMIRQKIFHTGPVPPVYDQYLPACGLSHAFDPDKTTPTSRNPPWRRHPGNKARYIYGDDEFLVFVRKYSYTVWAFQQGFPAPNHSERSTTSLYTPEANRHDDEKRVAEV
jgi:hypothetical protein